MVVESFITSLWWLNIYEVIITFITISTNDFITEHSPLDGAMTLSIMILIILTLLLMALIIMRHSP
jgi:hypothetical protein